MAKKSIFDTIKSTASRVYDQLNPLDNNLTYKQRTPTTSNSLGQQAAHVGSQVAHTLADPLVQFPLDVGSLGYNKLVAPAFNLPKQDIRTNPVLGGVARNVGATGSVRQAIGSGIQTGLTIGTGGLSRVAEGTAARVLPRTIPAIFANRAANVATGGIVGGGFGVGQGISEGHTAKQILTRDLPIGATLGAALPAAGHAFGAGVRAVRGGASTEGARLQLGGAPAKSTVTTAPNNAVTARELKELVALHRKRFDDNNVQIADLEPALSGRYHRDMVTIAQGASDKIGTLNHEHIHKAIGQFLSKEEIEGLYKDIVSIRGGKSAVKKYYGANGYKGADWRHAAEEEIANHFNAFLEQQTVGIKGENVATRIARWAADRGLPQRVVDIFYKLAERIRWHYAPRRAQAAQNLEDFYSKVDNGAFKGALRTTQPEFYLTKKMFNSGEGKSTLKTTPAAVTKTRESIINTARMDISQAAKEDLAKTVQDNQVAIKEKVGAPLTIKEVVNRAKTKGKVYQTGRAREDTVDAVAKLKNTRDRVAQLQQKSTDGIALTAQEQAELIQHTVTVATRQADIARQLGSLRATATPEEKTLLSTALEKLAKKGHDVDALLNAAKNFNLNDPKQLTQFYRMFDKATKEDWFDKLRYSSMLSSPVTHIRNAAANVVGGTVVAPATKLVAGALDAGRAAITGGERTRFAGEVGAYGKGYANSFKSATQAFGDVMTGKSLVNNPDINLSATLPLATTGVAGKLDSVLSVTGKLMEAADAFGSQLAAGGERRALKYRQSKGVKVTNPESQAHEAGQYQLFRSDLGGKDQGHLLNAIDFIPQQIFKARSSDNPWLRTLAKLTFPFVKTPVNISKQMLEYSPLGLLTTIGAKDKTNQIAKAVLGTMAVTTTGAALAANDALTFGVPTDKNEKARFLAEGKQPYSIKIGNKWVSYQYLHPAISFQLASMASVKQALDSGKIDDSTADKVLSGLAGASKFFVDQSYFKSGQDFINNIQGQALNSPVSAVASSLANTASQAIPFRALATWIDNMVDQTQRKTDYNASFLQQFGQNLSKQLPGLSQNTPAQTDATGAPIQKQHPVINALSPAKISTDTGGNLSDIYAPLGGNAEKQAAYRAAGLTGKDANRFLQMTATQQHDAALKDPVMRRFYDLKQTADIHSRPDLVLPTGIDGESADTLNKFNRLTSAEKEQLYASDPAAEYQYHEAAYQRDKALGKYTKTEQAIKEKALHKESIGSNYNQDTRDLYGMSLNNLADYLDSNPDQEAVNQLLDYDQALVDGGIIAKSKFSRTAPGQRSGTGTSKKFSAPKASFGSTKAAPTPTIRTRSARKVAVKARTRGNSGKGTLKIKRG